MEKARVYEKEIVIPTYEVGEEDKNPMFFEHRVYQGSSGKVYPYRVTEKIFDEKKDKTYHAVILENKWLYVIVLPELGGRIYTAYDKTNGYDFVYHNKVIKPALVGLLGPWISGGIEFNWPQHHRPDTFSPVNFKIEQHDGRATVFVGETERMFGLKQTTEISIYTDRSYIEIKTRVANETDQTKTFLWWANPAVKVNDDTKTVMPLDVTAVMDHGKRAVSTYPIATGFYYKADYRKGVDISRYKNIEVPTSFMAYKSDFDFVGGYDEKKEAGILHVANHHVSPGKKQWTWGSGDFGKAWDRNLTDDDGAYVELMTGSFTDNQPDFTFIKPLESKSFTEYFMPYHAVSTIYQANEDFCFGVEGTTLTVHSSIVAKARISIFSGKEEFVCDFNFTPLASCKLKLKDDTAKISIAYDGKVLTFDKNKMKNYEIPSAATACPAPKDCKSQEELYLYAKHITQYRHATRRAEDYYKEGLSRDADDLRLNNGYGELLYARGEVHLAIPYFLRATARATIKNPNPESTETFFNLGNALRMTGDNDGAYDAYYKCLWSDERKAAALTALAEIDIVNGETAKAQAHINMALVFNQDNNRALRLLARTLQAGDDATTDVYKRCLQNDKLDILAAYALSGKGALKGVSDYEIKNFAKEFFAVRDFQRAKQLLLDFATENKEETLAVFYLAYAKMMLGENAMADVAYAQKVYEGGNFQFASDLFDEIVLKSIIEKYDSPVAAYLLGNYCYDKTRYKEGAEWWEKAVCQLPTFAAAKRNLALYAFNKKRDLAAALAHLESAFFENKSDARVMSELVSLYRIAKKDNEFLFSFLTEHMPLTKARDDLYLEYLTLLVIRDEIEKAEMLILARKFHPWEGGEGKVTKLYKEINIALSKKLADKGDFESAVEKCKNCFAFPHNLGEGKLALDGDNDVYYVLGTIYEKFGALNKANECYQKATENLLELKDAIYYNDNPVEYYFYAAKAYLKLQDKAQAENIKNVFLKLAVAKKEEEAEIDYFAVSLPDLLVWEQDLKEKNIAFGDYLIKLANQI